MTNRATLGRVLLGAGAALCVIAPFLSWIAHGPCRGWFCYVPLGSPLPARYEALRHGWHAAPGPCVALAVLAGGAAACAALPRWAARARRWLAAGALVAGAWVLTLAIVDDFVSYAGYQRSGYPAGFAVGGFAGTAGAALVLAGALLTTTPAGRSRAPWARRPSPWASRTAAPPA